jgi:hypothetical protein
MNPRDKDDHPFDQSEQKLRDQFLQVREAIYKVNDDNLVIMPKAKVDETALAALRYLKQEEGRGSSGSNRLDMDSPIDGAVLSKANPHTGVAAGQYMAFYQGVRDEYEKLRVQGVPTSELGCPAHASLHEIRSVQADLDAQRQQLEQRKELDREREQPKSEISNHALGGRSIFS